MSTPNSPCAACKIQRRKCTQECVFAPYFPPDQPQKFANVHKIFGASNIAKLLNELNTAQREDAVNSLAYEAEARLRDPVYGCVGLISILQHRLKELQTDLYNAKKELAQYIGPQAMLPIFQSPPPYMAAAAQTHISNPIMGIPTGVAAAATHGGQLMFREPQQQNQHQSQIFEAQQQLAVALAAREQQQQEMYRGYENQQQDQIMMRFNRGFDCSNSVTTSSNTNNINNGFNQITVAAASAAVMSPCLALGPFDNNNTHYQIQTEQVDHNQLQAQIFLQPQQQEQQSQQTQQQRQRSGSDGGESASPSC